MGFIGSNLALRLAAEGAEVTVIDPVIAGCGGNPHNLGSTPIRIIPENIGEPEAFSATLREADVIFNLAGEISHIHSMRAPRRDADLNAVAQLRFLEECALQAPGIRVVYASTRQIYGSPRYLPVDENHPILPIDFNGVHKAAATSYHQLFTTMGRLDAISLCLTNVYGPRMALHLSCQGFLGTFLRRALLSAPIEIFGDGRQLRDPVYVEDAVDAFLLAGLADNPQSRRYNVGGPEALPLRRVAEITSAAAHGPAPIFRPFPDERKSIDIGSYTTDFHLIREELGWEPQISFQQGICESIKFYRRELEHYLGDRCADPGCALDAEFAYRH